MNATKSVQRAFLVVLGVGIVMVASYYLLSAFRIGRFGQPTDIGGGAVALLGYVAVAVGLGGAVVTALVQRRALARNRDR